MPAELFDRVSLTAGHGNSCKEQEARKTLEKSAFEGKNFLYKPEINRSFALVVSPQQESTSYNQSNDGDKQEPAETGALVAYPSPGSSFGPQTKD